jgi:hypothetical protein
MVAIPPVEIAYDEATSPFAAKARKTVVDPTVSIPVVQAVLRAIPWELAVTVT